MLFRSLSAHAGIYSSAGPLLPELAPSRGRQSEGPTRKGGNVVNGYGDMAVLSEINDLLFFPPNPSFLHHTPHRNFGYESALDTNCFSELMSADRRCSSRDATTAEKRDESQLQDLATALTLRGVRRRGRCPEGHRPHGRCIQRGLDIGTASDRHSE